MIAVCLTVLAVVVGDQAIKHMVRRLISGDALALGPCGSVRVVAGRLLLGRLGGQFSAVTTWSIWAAATASLVIASSLARIDPVLVGLLIGGSASHAVESSVRGSITDFICVRNRTAFNLADLALAAGAIGIVAELLRFLHHHLA
jgi:signal peptidase II